MVRYLFGLPFALVYLTAVAGSVPALPPVNGVFLLCATIAGMLQIVATVLLIHLFTFRNFAVGSTYARTEVMLTALLGATFFYEYISPAGWLAILVCVLGVLAISLSRTGGPDRLWNRSAAFGLGAGLSFALTSLLIRRASLSLDEDNALLAAAMTLVYMVTMQTVITVAWIMWRERGQFRLVLARWRPSLFVGITSVAGSGGWFTAMTLERASYVKTLGQVEFLISLGIAIFYFREVPTRREVTGMLLIVTGIVALLLAP